MDYLLNTFKVVLSGIILALAAGNLLEILSPESKFLTTLLVFLFWNVSGSRYVIIKHQAYVKATKHN